MGVREMFCIDMYTNQRAILYIHIKKKEDVWTKYLGGRDSQNRI